MRPWKPLGARLPPTAGRGEEMGGRSMELACIVKAGGETEDEIKKKEGVQG